MTGLCIICGKPVPPDCRGRHRATCGSRVCRGKASVNKRFLNDVADWPVVTGEIAADFRAHNLPPRLPMFGFKIVPADRRSYAGCSAAYTAGV